MSDESAKPRAAMWLDWSEHWWKETHNPLHVWRTLAVCLNSEPPLPIPDWCMPYLANTASNIESLMSGRDFRSGHAPVLPGKAHALTSEALGLGRQGKKSVFVEIAEASDLQRHAMEAARGHDAVEAIKKEHSVAEDRAKRLLTKGARLARQR